MPHTVYILECADNTLYTGCTNNIKQRLREHNTSTRGAKYTRARRPVTLVYTQTFRALAAARKREAEIKRLTRKEKIRLLTHLTRFSLSFRPSPFGYRSGQAVAASGGLAMPQ